MSNISHSWSVITVWSKLSPGFLCVVLCVFVTLQFCPCFGSSWCILGHELCDFADEIRLLSATFAGLAPFLQNLLQVLHLELFQVHWTQVQLFVCMGWKKNSQTSQTIGDSWSLMCQKPLKTIYYMHVIKKVFQIWLVIFFLRFIVSNNKFVTTLHFFCKGRDD